MASTEDNVNELSLDNAEQLAQQLQSAHRYAAGFYQRFLPLLYNAARSRGFNSKDWYSPRFSRPPKSKSKSTPERKWAWDLLPMCYTHFRFSRKITNSKKEEIHTRLEITFEPDPGLNKEKSPGYPDPVKMVNETPSISISVWHGKDDLDELWNKGSEEKSERVGQLTKYGLGLINIHNRISLANFMIRPEKEIDGVLANLPEEDFA